MGNAAGAPPASSPSTIYTQVTTMEDAKKRSAERDGKLKNQNPREILRELQLGNERFKSKRSELPPMSLVARNNLINGQAPKVMVIGTSDSRVPIEVIFDQGPGDVFVCRNAGAVVGERVLGTIEYGVFHLGIKLLVVMCNQGCGAIRAARSPVSVLKNEPPRLRTMLLGIHDELERCRGSLDAISDPVERDRQTMLVNSHAQVRAMLREPVLRAKVDSGEILVLAAYYSISTGEVEFSEVDPSRAANVPIGTMVAHKALVTHKPKQGGCVTDNSAPSPPSMSMQGDVDYLDSWSSGGLVNRESQRPPADILEMLKEGNHRFWTGTPIARAPSASSGRGPKCMVVGCADSRVPVEIVFDQSAGDIYVARNAGNLWTTTVAASIELAIYHLGVKLIVVLGHQGCGAVKASQMKVPAINGLTPKLRDMLLDMQETIEYCFETLGHIQDPNARDREAVIANAQQQVRKILREPAVRAKVDSGEVMIVAGFYEITSGIVDFVPLPKEAYPVAQSFALVPGYGATPLGPRMVMNDGEYVSTSGNIFKGGIGGRKVTHQDMASNPGGVVV